MHVMQVLRSRIVRGHYAGKLPGERALAAELGTNPKTIQLALIRLEAVGMIRRVERHGTFAVPPAELPRSAGIVYARLVSKPPFTLWGDASFWSSAIVYGFHKAARERGLTIALEYSDDVDRVLDDALAEARTAGCVGTCILSLAVETKHALRLAQAQGPVVLADWEIEHPLVPCIVFDNFGAGRLVAEHLVKLGHRRIAFVNYASPSPNMRERLRGVEQFLSDVGSPLARKVFFQGHNFEDIAGLLAAPDPPTAIISGSRHVAEILIELALNGGTRIPQDLSVVTFGGGQVLGRRRITMAAMDHEALGRRALEMLLDERGAASPPRVVLPVTLADAATTAPPAAP